MAITLKTATDTYTLTDPQPITINSELQNKYTLKARDLRDGEAYESNEGRIYIGNRFESFVAFSVDGSSVISSGDWLTTFRAVNMEVNVSYA